MPNPYHQSRCCILVASCDAYQDLWKPFFDTFFRQWPACPYTIYLLSNRATASISRVRPITTGTDTSWSANLRNGLQQIKEEFVLLFLEDLILTAAVDTARVEKLIAWSVEHDADCTKMLPVPPPDHPENDMVGCVSAGTLYRVSTVMTFWKRSVLDAILVDSENAWEFEVFGSVRSDRFCRFYAAHSHSFTFLNAVTRGKWRPEAVTFLRKLGLLADTAARPKLSLLEQGQFRLRLMRYSCLQLFPAGKRRMIRGLLTHSAKL
jgi:hypothetical protein